MKVFRVGWKLLILIILIGFGLLYYASNKVDEKYQAAIMAMNNGEWSRGVSLILETPHYKEASELYIYMYPHKLFYSAYTTEADAIKGYGMGADFIKQESEKLKGTPSEKYIPELKDLESVFNFKIIELNAKILDEPQRKNLDEAVKLIKSRGYQEALLKLQAIENNSIYEIDKQELIKYISFQNVIPTNNLEAIKEAASLLNPNYSGVLAQEIKTSIGGYMNSLEWNELYSAKAEKVTGNGDKEETPNTIQVEQPESNVKNRSVITGMKREEVVSILGEPAASNKIQNKYGNFEEMQYGSNRFIYLENNIVTAVK